MSLGFNGSTFLVLSGSEYVSAGCLTDFDISFSGDRIDVTCSDDYIKQSEVGAFDVVINVGLLYTSDASDILDGMLTAASFDASDLNYRILLSDARTIDFTGQVLSINTSGSNGSALTAKLSFVVNDLTVG